MDYKIEVRRILELEGISLKKFSELSGLNYGYVRNILKPSEFNEVNWQKTFVMGYNLGREDVSEKISGIDINLLP